MSAKQNDQAVTDDQELAKVLANNTAQQKAAVAGATGADNPGGLQFEESPVPAGQQPTTDTSATTSAPTITPSPSVTAAKSAATTPAVPPTAAPSAPSTSDLGTTSPTPTTPVGNSSLDTIKKDALEELRPLVNKLNLPPEEKFDTLLLIIRSTDDQSLLTAAHDAAKAIQDDARRAQALLDVIKEIDYFSGQSVQI